MERQISIFVKIRDGLLVLDPPSEGKIDKIDPQSKKKIIRALKPCCEACLLCSGVTNIDGDILLTERGVPVGNEVNLKRCCDLPGKVVNVPGKNIISVSE